MFDCSTVKTETKVNWDLIKDWYKQNPGSEEKPVLNYPVEIKYEVSTIVSINNDDELETANEECDEKD